MIKAVVNKIIDHSVVDGVGNRSVIFFQGCNLNCHYCHNPETINHCYHCGVCVTHCPQKALSFQDDKVVYDRLKCVDCDTCIKVCPYDSSPKTALLSVDDVLTKIKQNIPFIRGITLSGGECTLNATFIKALFKEAKALNLSTLLDSNGTYDFTLDPEILDHCDGVIIDIKAINAHIHQSITKADNQLIIKNAQYLAQIGKLTEIRTVVIANILDNHHTVDQITKLLAPYLTISPISYKLIKYRHFGVRKKYLYLQEPSDDLMNELQVIAYNNGFNDIILI
ncbi:MAG: YjjW family glycine radical enzyme activase [Erysipelotrichaceae bacterium]|nr:YjjW family glycine radical enzyme activase [Erysipelotrichaceae bacterium]